MKKNIIALAISLVVLGTPFLALADSFSLSPTSTASGSEGSLNISYSSSQGYTHLIFYVFKSSGAFLEHSAEQTFSTTFSSTWGGVSLATGLATDTYSVLGIYEGSAGEFSGWGGDCGNTLTACESARTATNQWQAATEIVTSGGGGGGGGGSSTAALAPMYNQTSTILAANAAENEAVLLPLWLLEHYQADLVYVGIFLALVGAIFGGAKLLGFL